MKTNIVFALFLSYSSSLLAADYVWWEAEAANKHNFPTTSAFAPETLKRERLSGGDWLHANHNRLGTTLYARYVIEVPQTGQYQFWVRKFWKHGPFKWRFDQQKWGYYTREYANADRVSLSDFVEVNWVNLGTVTLNAGQHEFYFENTDAVSEGTKTISLDSKGRSRQGASAFAIDCFILTQKPFLPNGKLKPGEKYHRTEKGWFAFEPGLDSFAKTALLDLRAFNHAYSGEKGFLGTKEMDFYFDKEPHQRVTFWGTVVGRELIMQAPETIDHFTRRLAKLGVNMVRMHGAFHGGVKGDYLGISDNFLDHFDYFIAALKKQGIYLMLNTYYDRWYNAQLAGFPGYEKLRHSIHYFFIHPKAHQLWKTQIRRLLARKNPYTGLRNIQDPTVAIIQIVNEDNYFWHSFRPYKTIPAPVMAVLEKRYGDWLQRKYGSLKATQAAWGNDFPQVRGDFFQLGRVGLGKVPTAHPRSYDRIQFLTEDMRWILEHLQSFLQHELGFRGVVNGGNWLSANNTLEALDKYANSINEVMDRHGVSFTGYLLPPDQKSRYEFSEGDIYADRSAMKNPKTAQLQEIQYAGKAHILSEPKSKMPNRFRTEFLPLLTVYHSLMGIDAQTHFSAEPYWQMTHRRDSLETPIGMGQAPALSLIYTRGYLKKGPVVWRQALKLADLYSLKLDPSHQINPLSFFVGQIVRVIGEAPGETQQMNLSPYIDRNQKIIRSATGELIWDWDQGLVTVDAPRAQAIFGFTKTRRPVTTTDVTFAIANEYGSYFVVSMDDKPLSQSAKILVQVVTEDKNYGWTTKPMTNVSFRRPQKITMDGLKISDLGSAPLIIKNLAGSITLKRSDAARLKVTALDFNGYPRQELPGGRGKSVHIDLLPDCLYYIIDKK